MAIERVDSTVARLLDALGLSSVAALSHLAKSWEEIVGTLVSAKTCPARLKGGVLTVCAVSSAWAQELSMSRSTVIERIDAVLGPGKVREIRVVVGTVPETADGGPPPEGAGPRGDGPEEAPPQPAPEGIENVADAEMREILAGLARKAASRRR